MEKKRWRNRGGRREMAESWRRRVGGGEVEEEEKLVKRDMAKREEVGNVWLQRWFRWRRSHWLEK